MKSGEEEEEKKSRKRHKKRGRTKVRGEDGG